MTDASNTEVEARLMKAILLQPGGRTEEPPDRPTRRAYSHTLPKTERVELRLDRRECEEVRADCARWRMNRSMLLCAGREGAHFASLAGIDPRDFPAFVKRLSEVVPLADLKKQLGL